jgi:DNA-binding MarR family transcriptional regulator
MFLVSICRAGIVGSTVELRHLRYFVAVAETQNVLRATTQKLHVSQPAVSRQIRDLEDELGVKLFERTGKAVSLTDAGRLFLKEACTVLERTDEAVHKTLRLTLRSLRETKLILRFSSLQRIHHRIRILFIHRCQREIIFLKQPNRFQISWAQFCLDHFQFYFFKPELKNSWYHLLHNSFSMVFR